MFRFVDSHEAPFKAYSLAYHPTVQVDELEASTKAILPASCIPPDIGSGPLCFLVQGSDEVYPLYVTVHEFSAGEGMIYLPRALMEQAFIADGGTVTIQRTHPPSVSKIILRPTDARFAREVDDPKAVLEKAIVERYQILRRGDLLSVGEWALEIETLEPAEVVCTYESDPVVDFLPSHEDIRREKEEAVKCLEDEAKLVEDNQVEDDMVRGGTVTGYVPFGGEGMCLSGTSITSGITSSHITSSIHSDSTQMPSRKPRPSRTTPRKDFSSFSGAGQRLGTG